MKIVLTQEYGSFDNYQMVETPLPEPKAGEVRIKIAAWGVGYVEALTALGRYQIVAPLPYTPGCEIAGVIDAVGADVSSIRVGERVMSYSPSGLAECVVVPAENATPLAPSVDFKAAAAFSVNFSTALHALKDRGHLKTGERLLVMGASGGTGVAAVQLGRIMGARVIAVCSTQEKRDFALKHGADVAIDTNIEGWRDRLKEAAGGKGVDVIFDPVCGPLFEPAFKSLAWNGRHLVVGFAGGQIPSLKANLALVKSASLIGVDIRQFGIFAQDESRANKLQLMEWFAAGAITSPYGKVFPFMHFREAFEYALSGKAIAKTILESAL